MSNPASFEEITKPSTPVEKWFADYRILYTDEVLGTPAKLAALKDDHEESRWWEVFNEGEVAQARLDHLDDLSTLCDPRFDLATQLARLGDHIEQLHGELTSRAIHHDDSEHTMPAVEEAKRKAKVKDTLSLRTVLTGQQQIDS